MEIKLHFLGQQIQNWVYPHNLKAFEAKQRVISGILDKYETYPPNLEHFEPKQRIM